MGLTKKKGVSSKRPDQLNYDFALGSLQSPQHEPSAAQECLPVTAETALDLSFAQHFFLSVAAMVQHFELSVAHAAF